MARNMDLRQSIGRGGWALGSYILLEAYIRESSLWQEPLQERPKEARRTPKSIQEHAKRGQRAAQERPGRRQETLGTSKSGSRAMKKASQESFGSNTALKTRKP